MKPTYTKLAANGTDLPADHPNYGPDKHLAVRVTRADIPGWSLIVSAYRCGERATFNNAQAQAAAHEAYGWKWRAPTVEELFLVADRSRPEVGMDTNFFPDAEGYEFTWSADVDATSPSGYAWFVNLGFGFSFWSGQSFRYHVRAVRAGQPVGL